MKLSIVSYLDEAATAEVRALQTTLSELTGSRASLVSWAPHITIGDGVVADGSDGLERLATKLQQITLGHQTFELTAARFGFRDSRPIGEGEVSTPYVLEIVADVSKPLLELVESVDTTTHDDKKWYVMPRPYQPHITLAFRDLDKAGYEAGIEYLRGQEVAIRSWIDHISLVEMRPGQDIEQVRAPLMQ